MTEAEKIIQDILNNRNPLEMVKEYGQEYILYFEEYNAMAKRIKEQVEEKKQ